jgi:signal peptide peptidase SppA
MHDIPHIISAARRTPWATTREHLALIRRLLYQRAHGYDVKADANAIEIVKAAEARQRVTRVGNIATLPVIGTIAHKMNLMTALSGGVSTELLERDVRAAVADPDVSAILFEVDSPGGTVTGLPELHATIMELRGKKPMAASINALSASAAYWITSAISDISITPSGEAGSIGVYAMHVDESVALEQEGVKVTLIHYGEHKVEGNPWEPLSDEAKAEIQDSVDAYGKMFEKDIARGRGISVQDVREKFGQGLIFRAKEAKERGLVDRIETRDETLSRITRAGSKGRTSADLNQKVVLSDRFI